MIPTMPLYITVLILSILSMGNIKEIADRDQKLNRKHDAISIFSVKCK